ncbi:MAG TPA: hypothetical protein VGH89_28715 [Pseudonocardia sp.]
MYLSAERTALINQTIMRTFEQSSIAWQAIPHWDTCDPGQFRVRPDLFPSVPASPANPPDEFVYPPIGGPSIRMSGCRTRFYITLAQATAPTPDALLASVIGRTVDLASQFDNEVLSALGTASAYRPVQLANAGLNAPDVLTALLTGRHYLEDAGYRADSCLLASTAHYLEINQLVDGLLVAEGLLSGANINSLFRVSTLESSLMVGRRREIAPRGAATASPGEEPVDLAISLPPSLEIVGDDASGQVELVVRIRFAPRIKDPKSIVVLGPTPPPPPDDSDA